MTASFHDVELLSAYLDGQLNPADSAQLESRLTSDAGLRAVLDDLLAARGLLRQLPARRAPHNFTLTPGMAGIRPPEPRAYPGLRFATVLATLLFLVTFAVNGLTPIAAARLAAAPAPAYGVGGGGGGGPSAPQESAPTAEVPAQPFAASLSTPTPEAALSLAPAGTPANDSGVAPTVGPSAKGFAPGSGNSSPTRGPAGVPVPVVWQIALAAIALLCGAAAWTLRRSNERIIRRRWDRK